MKHRTAYIVRQGKIDAPCASYLAGLDITSSRRVLEPDQGGGMSTMGRIELFRTRCIEVYFGVGALRLREMALRVFI